MCVHSVIAPLHAVFHWWCQVQQSDIQVKVKVFKYVNAHKGNCMPNTKKASA
uniref:Uncharacterized protein n=1 Tax=Anguilla anguilla TaxID=7936 RepID=A0A0E9UUW8_ANGAN